MLKRLRLKFICINMTIVTAMLLLIFLVVLGVTRHDLERQSLSMMDTEEHREHGPRGKPPRMELPSFTLNYDENGAVTVSGDEDLFDPGDAAFLEEIAAEAFSSERKTGIIPGYRLRFFRMGPSHSPTIVFADAEFELRTLSDLYKVCLLIGSISFAVFLVISILLSRWAIKPVAAAWQQQKQFIADASHELKTPLAVILTNTELLRVSEAGSQEQQNCTESIRAMSEQMRGLVESLLDLAHLEGDAERSTMTEVDLSSTVSRALLPFEALFFEKGLQLAEHIAPDIRVKGDSAKLKQALEILLDNAQKYADTGTEVTVTLQQIHRGTCRLSVANRGTPLSPEELKNIFKRFYRGDKARAMNRSYGLGLSIAEKIVSEHRGKIFAESRDGLNIFSIQLPTV